MPPRLHHLALRTRDVSTLSQFYQYWLGFTVWQTRSAASIWLALEAFVYSSELDMSRLRDLVD